jgi:hypothetical protein
MRGIVLGCCALCAGGGAYVLHTSNSGIDYEGSIPAIHAQLAAMPMPEELSDSLEKNGDGSVITDADQPDAVSWHFFVKGQEIGQLTAMLKPSGPNATNVQVEFDPGKALPKGSDARALAMQPLVEQVAETFMAEQIDATLEHHPFNKRAVGLQLASYVASHPKEMRQYMTKVQSLSEQASTMPEGAYQPRMKGESRPPEARFEPGKPMVSAKPMSDLSSYNCRGDYC